jgi:hypothetical protein
MNDDVAAYLTRKSRETALLNACLDPPLALREPASVDEVIETKLELAGALRAERALASWTATETAHRAIDEWQSGAFTFSYGYQRADLSIRGPAIYPAVEDKGYAVETLYTNAGMGAAAALFTGLCHVYHSLHLHLPRDGYPETRELLERFGSRIRLASWRLRRTLPTLAGARVLLVDSMTSAIPHADDPMPRDTAIVVFDTTCFWRTSGRIARVVRWARRHDVPIALFRSHNKLDSFGVEYGRLGSIVLSWRRRGPSRRVRDVVRETRDAIRLLGVAAMPSHLPPFADEGAYMRASCERTAALVRNARRLYRRLRTTPLAPGVRLYPHGLYLTISPAADLRVQDVKRAASALSAALSEKALPARHAGSFGFDFIAIEWFSDPRTGKYVMRIAPGDGPQSMIDALADGIVDWFSLQTAGAMPAAARPMAPAPAPPTA